MASRNPYLGNPLVQGLGALSQGIQLGEQQKAQKAAREQAMQRQAMLDAAKAQLDRSQAGSYDASAYKDRAEADNYGNVAGNTRKENLMSQIAAATAQIPDMYTAAVTRNDRSQLDRHIAYINYLQGQLQGGGSPQVAPSGIPASPLQGDYQNPVGVGMSMPSPTGGQGGNLGGPSFAGPSLIGGNLGDMGGVPSGMPPPMGGSAGNLGVPSVPAGVPLTPFAQQLQDASKPAPLDIGGQFGIPKPVEAPAYVPPKPVAQQGIPQQAPARFPEITQAPQQGVGLTNSPLELSQLAQADEAKAQAKKYMADAIAQSIKNRDVTPILEKIRIAPANERPFMAQAANDTFDQLGINKHIPVPNSSEYPGTYHPDLVVQSELDKTAAGIHNQNLNTIVNQAHVADERTHMKRQDETAAAAQKATETHYGNQDDIAGDKFNYQKDQGFKNNPDTQKKISSYTSQITSLQTAIDNANKAQIAAVANTTITPQARKIILKTQDDIKHDALVKQQDLKDKIDTLGQAQQSSSSNYGNLPTNPLAPSYIDKAIQACKATGAGSGGHCDKLARISTEKTDPVNAQYFDRKPGATALTTLRNFQNAGKAFPLKPGMALPPGTLVFSTKLGKGAGPHGADAGHVAMIGSDGQPNDQHNKNQIALGKFDYFVPPSGSAPKGAPRGNQTTAKGKSIKVGSKTFTVEM